ncbi:MAG: hypothetical protein M1831_005870 [Alyxoria varia]|nr:MAG: hypothetical protein M1831_005870 [Alyxoria varia]
MIHRSKTEDGNHAAPKPSYMSNKQMGDYLNDLRNTRMARPQGSRPQPGSLASRRSMTSTGSYPRESLSSRSSRDGTFSRSSSALSYRRGDDMSLSGRTSPEKMQQSMARDQRQREDEKRESHQVRLALEEVDQHEEQSLVVAAQREASELIWKHQNPNAPYAAPDGPNKASAQQSTSADSRGAQADEENVHNEERTKSKVSPEEEAEPRRSPSKKLARAFSFSRLANRRRSGSSRQVSGGSLKRPFPNSREHIYEDTVTRRVHEELHLSPEKPPAHSHVRKNPFARAHSNKQNLRSSNRNSIVDSDSAAKNHHALSLENSFEEHQSRASLNARDTGSKFVEACDEEDPKYKDGVEVRSDDIRAATSMRFRDRSPKLPSPTYVSDSPGRPIVSFRSDWEPLDQDKTQSNEKDMSRARPSPSPTRVPGGSSKHANKPVSAPVIPTINLPDTDIPNKAKHETFKHVDPRLSVDDVEKPPIPTISVSDSPSKVGRNGETFGRSDVKAPSIEEPHTTTAGHGSRHSQASRKSGNQRTGHMGRDHQSHQRGAPKSRPSPHHSVTAPSSTSLPHWSPANIRSSALCAQCALPIQGRIVSAAGTRFHPECFICYNCNEALECVEFYPEPFAKREGRLDRIQRRMDGEEVDAPEGVSFAEDNDDSLRFYCALDFHEFFSPRCKSCKTPIEGEVIVACGAEWHVGHFFCAQCGNPFDPTNPYIERDGYAWNVAANLKTGGTFYEVTAKIRCVLVARIDD